MAGRSRSLIAEIFSEQVAVRADSPAVLCEGRQLTYARLDRESDLIAARLAEQGVGDGDIVGIALRRSELCAVAWLGVAKVNGVCLWLDPDYPADRLALMIEDAMPSVAVIAQDANEATRELTAALRTVTAERATTGGVGPLAPYASRPFASRPTAPAESAAYVIYTSGSTGRPKGTILTSTGLRSLLDTAVQGFGAGPGSRVLQFTSMSFDVAFLEMSMALLLGGSLVVVPGERRVAEPAFLELLREHRVTHAALPPAFLELLPEETPLPEGLTIMTGADKVPLALAGRWARRARVVACYGLTEATVNSTLWDYDAGWEGAVAPLGTEDPGTTAHLLDDTLRPVPAGQPGELYIGGDGLARGYLHRPALTAQRFVADPFGAPGARMYRTGDRAVRHGSGVLEFLGRVDGQLKIRGHRIEPTDVESVLLRHPAVAQAVVTARQDSAGGAQLAAYVVAAEGVDIDERELRRYVSRTLPAYMVPSLLVPVPGLTVLPSGKLDRRAAPRTAPAPLPAEADEDALRQLLSATLGCDIEDLDGGLDFVALGGHSLTAMRFATACRRQFGGEPAIGDVFTARSVRELLASLTRGGPDRPRPGARGNGPLLLSYEQERLWVLEALSGDGTHYHVPWAWQVHGDLDTEALRGALEDLAARHDILRTRFPAAHGSPRQDILPPERHTLDYAVLPTDGQEMPATVRAAAKESFDLEARPPWRARVFTAPGSPPVVLLCLHHVLVDDWSVDRLATELSQAYAARLDPAIAPPARRDLQFADFSAWQRRLHDASTEGPDAMAVGVGFWRGFLRGVPVESGVPLDRVRPDVPVVRGETFVRRWSGERHAGVRGLARGVGSSVYMVVHAALVAVLAEAGAGSDVVVGCPVSTRRGEELEDVVGFFVNTVALRSDVGGGPSFGELLVRVRDADLRAFDRGDVPFNRVVEAVNPPRHPSRNPLFQVLLAQQHHTGRAPSLGDAPGTALPISTGKAIFDLAVDFHELSRGGMELTVEFGSALLDRSTVEAVVDGMERLLDGAVAGEERVIRAVDRAPSVLARVPEPVVAAGEGTVAVLRRLFSEVLDQPDVRDQDSFFDLGGHSLTAMRLINAIERELGVRPRVAGLFGHPTPSGLARHLPTDRSAPPEFTGPAPEQGPVPLSYEQERLWILEAMSGTGTLYHVPWAWRTRGRLDTAALRGAMEDLIARHEILRTRFPQVDGVPVQVVLPADRARPDFTELPTDEGEVAEAVAAAARATFRPEDEPPFRIRVFTLRDDDHVVLVCLHHLLTDDRSMRQLATELSLAYAARLRGNPVPHAPAHPQFADYSRWQRRTSRNALGPDAMAVGVGFWRGFLRGVPVESGVPLDRVRPDVPVVRGETFVRRWSGERHAGVRGLARGVGSSVYMVVHAALVAVLAEAGAGSDVVVGCPVSTRRGEELEDVVGFFVNTVALRSDVGGGPSFGELLVRVRDADLRAFDRGDVPFNRVVEAVNPPRHPSRNPLFQVLLAQQHHTRLVPDLDGGADSTPFPVASREAAFDLAVAFSELSGGGMELTVEFGSALLDRSTVEAVVDGMERLLDGAVAGEERVIRAVDRAPSVLARVPEPVVAACEGTVAVLRRLFSEVLDQPDVRDQDSFFDLGGHSLTAMRLITRIRERFGVRVPVRTLMRKPTLMSLAAEIESRAESGVRPG